MARFHHPNYIALLGLLLTLLLQSNAAPRPVAAVAELEARAVDACFEAEGQYPHHRHHPPLPETLEIRAESSGSNEDDATLRICQKPHLHLCHPPALDTRSDNEREVEDASASVPTDLPGILVPPSLLPPKHHPPLNARSDDEIQPVDDSTLRECTRHRLHHCPPALDARSDGATETEDVPGSSTYHPHHPSYPPYPPSGVPVPPHLPPHSSRSLDTSSEGEEGPTSGYYPPPPPPPSPSPYRPPPPPHPPRSLDARTEVGERSSDSLNLRARNEDSAEASDFYIPPNCTKLGCPP